MDRFGKASPNSSSLPVPQYLTGKDRKRIRIPCVGYLLLQEEHLSLLQIRLLLLLHSFWDFSDQGKLSPARMPHTFGRMSHHPYTPQQWHMEPIEFLLCSANFTVAAEWREYSSW